MLNPCNAKGVQVSESHKLVKNVYASRNFDHLRTDMSRPQAIGYEQMRSKRQVNAQLEFNRHGDYCVCVDALPAAHDHAGFNPFGQDALLAASRYVASSVLPDMFGQITFDLRIETVGGDGAYDTNLGHAVIAARASQSSIPAREDAMLWPENMLGVDWHNEAVVPDVERWAF